MTDLPTSFVRGDTYYIAGGSYGSHTFSTATSGSTLITIQRATVTDHGTDTGWNTSYDGQVTFAFSLTFSSSHWLLDGKTGTGFAMSTYGFVVAQPSNCAQQQHYVTMGTVDDITIRYMAVRCCDSSFDYEKYIFYNTIGTTLTDATFSHCYGENMQGLIYMVGASNVVTEYCYVTNAFSSSTHHGEIWDYIAIGTPNRHMVMRYCVATDGTGTGTVIANDSGPDTFALDGFECYGNVLMNGTGGNGVISTTTRAAMCNARIYNNTIYSGSSYWIAAGQSGSDSTIVSLCTNNVATNNLVYGRDATIGDFGATPWGHDYNYYVNCSSIPSEAHGYSGSANPFVNSSGFNLHLLAPTPAGAQLPSVYGTDMDGNVRGADGNWDIGAYEYGLATTNPVIVVSANSLNFGSILTNTVTTQTLSVQNGGSGTLAGSASVAAPFSIVSGGVYSLGAGQSQTVTVRYAPTAAGANNQTMTFTGGGGATVSVSGTATNPGPVVSAIIQNATDVDPSQPGLQVFTGTVVQYSGSATDPSGLPLTWQWIYSENGGPEVVVASGAGSVSPVSFTYDSSTAGSAFVWKLRVSDGLGTSESDLTVGVELAPPPAGTLSFTMSSATVTGSFVVTNGVLSQPATTTVTNGGVATIVFTVTNAGTYVIQASVNAPSLSANSFYVNIDSMPVDETMAWDIMPITSGFEQRFVGWRGTGTPDADQFVPNYFNLTNGTHTLYIVGREGGTELQSISFNRLPDAPQNLHVIALGP